MLFVFYRVQKVEPTENESTPQKRTAKLKDSQEQRRKQQVHSRMQVLLFRHKELLKKDILKKRALLEKELQIDIQVCRFIIFNICYTNHIHFYKYFPIISC